MFIFPQLKEWSDEMLVQYFEGSFSKETGEAFGFSNANDEPDNINTLREDNDTITQQIH